MDLVHARIPSRAAEKVREGYPWIFTSQIQTWSRAPQPGELVDVRDARDRRVGFAYANPNSPLALRMLYSPAAGERGTGGIPDERMEIFRKLDRAWSRRQALHLETDAYRLVWSEADGLPGLVIDRFGDRLVVQCLTAGMEARKSLVLDWLLTRQKPAGIYERSEGTGRSREGLPAVTGWLHPLAPTPALEAPVAISEGALKFWVDVAGGQKTGFYLDQRAARRFLQAQHFTGAVLDCFCYTGGLSFSALLAGAGSAWAVDSSARALATLQANAELNGLAGRVRTQRAKVTDFLKAAALRPERFELVILDPPAFARSREHKARALAALRELHRLAACVLAPKGFLLSCSCSHPIARKDLLNSAISGFRLAGRSLKVKAQFGPDADHPEKMQIPESRYLSCLYAQAGQ